MNFFENRAYVYQEEPVLWQKKFSSHLWPVRANVQPKSSIPIGAKVEISPTPQGFN
jgi:hypothetical protein